MIRNGLFVRAQRARWEKSATGVPLSHSLLPYVTGVEMCARARQKPWEKSETRVLSSHSLPHWTIPTKLSVFGQHTLLAKLAIGAPLSHSSWPCAIGTKRLAGHQQLLSGKSVIRVLSNHL